MIIEFRVFSNMPQPVLALRALIASPGDLEDERLAIPDVIAAWNATHSRDKAVIIEPVKWESHSTPVQGDRPQAIINQQLVDKCDFVIAVFWTKLGTSTGVADSGTVEEIMEFEKVGKPVLLYFSDRPISPSKQNSDQLAKLNEFKNSRQNAGLYHSYSDINQFREVLNRHLNEVVLGYLSGQPRTPSSDFTAASVVARPKPVTLEAIFQYRKEDFNAITLQRACALTIHATNNGVNTISGYELHVKIPKPLVHSSNQTGKVLHEEQTDSETVFQFPQSQDNPLPPLLPGRRQQIARVYCLVAEFNAHKRSEVSQQKIEICLFADGFAPQFLNVNLQKNPFDLMQQAYESLEFHRTYTL